MVCFAVAILIVLVISLIRERTQRKRAEQVRDGLKAIAVGHQRLQAGLYKDLYDEFRNDLDEWQAELDAVALSVRFHTPDMLFQAEASKLQPQLRAILDDFFPRYIRVLAREKYRGAIEEIRIEAHTSSEWSKTATSEEAYIRNMELTQNRARAALEFVLGISRTPIPRERQWMLSRLTANGLSSSKPRLLKNGNEDKMRSRRLEFRVAINAEKRITRIVEEGGLVE